MLPNAQPHITRNKQARGTYTVYKQHAETLFNVIVNRSLLVVVLSTEKADAEEAPFLLRTS